MILYATPPTPIENGGGIKKKFSEGVLSLADKKKLIIYYYVYVVCLPNDYMIHSKTINKTKEKRTDHWQNKRKMTDHCQNDTLFEYQCKTC